MSYLIPFSILILALICEMQYISRCGAEGVYYDYAIGHKYNVIFALLLFIIAALRSPNTGADTGQYYAMYKSILSANQPLSYYFDTVMEGIRSGSFRDGAMWQLFMKVASYIIPNAQLWMAFVAGLFIFACYKFIERYSLDPIISWVYMYSIYIFTFILQGFRQSIAMAIILFSFRYVDQRRLIKFLLMVALAYLFHQSAIIFAVVYPLAKMKRSSFYYIPILGSLVLSYIMPGSIVSILQNMISETRFNGYYAFGSGETLSIMGWVLLFLIFVFCYFFLKSSSISEDEDVNELKNKLLTITMIGLVFQAFVGVLSEMFRISYYFNMFNMALVANTCVCVSDRNQRIVRYGFILAMMAYVFYSGVFQYKFFWQG